jgi:hypothetical protein
MRSTGWRQPGHRKSVVTGFAMVRSDSPNMEGAMSACPRVAMKPFRRSLGHTSYTFYSSCLLRARNQLLQGLPTRPEAHVLAMPSANMPLDLPL